MNTSPIYERIIKDLDQRYEQDLFRKIEPCSGRPPINLSTNSYLALHANQEVIAAAKILLDDILSGNLASRLILESSPLYETLESELASWDKTETALVFTSGYAANVGIIQAVCTRSTEIFCDRLNHASIYDGISLSGSKLIRYHHIDMSDLKRRLQASKAEEKIIITDTVFSTDGDRAPLADICELAQKYNCMVMVDEAHATGIFGSTGSGMVEESGMSEYINIRMGTLSKAMAGLGGYFTGDTIIRNYLINFARSLIYSTGLPHSVLAFTVAAIQYTRNHSELGQELLKRSEQFRNRINSAGYSTLNSSTQIIPCMVNSKTEAIQLSRFLLQKGIYAPAIRPPTVPDGSSRIRISYHLGIKQAQEDFIIDQLLSWKKRHA
jgi:8-amino-7-oxononanoate synthase